MAVEILPAETPTAPYSPEKYHPGAVCLGSPLSPVACQIPRKTPKKGGALYLAPAVLWPL